MTQIWKPVDSHQLKAQGRVQVEGEAVRGIFLFTCPRCFYRQVADVTVSRPAPQVTVTCSNTVICGDGLMHFQVILPNHPQSKKLTTLNDLNLDDVQVVTRASQPLNMRPILQSMAQFSHPLVQALVAAFILHQEGKATEAFAKLTQAARVAEDTEPETILEQWSEDKNSVLSTLAQALKHYLHGEFRNSLVLASQAALLPFGWYTNDEEVIAAIYELLKESEELAFVA